jgi:hypothetical protein
VTALDVIYQIHPIARPFLEPLNFYRRFDQTFFLNKVRALTLALSPEGMASLAASDPEGEQTPESRKTLEDGLRSEIHFTLIHNIETVVCMMMAGFHRSAPPAIFMTQARQAVDYIEDLETSKFRKLSKGVAEDERSFYTAALFCGILIDDHPQWEQTLQDTVRLLKHCYVIRRLAHGAYNAYKHGMRMTFGATSLELAPPPADEEADPFYTPVVDSLDSSQYMIKRVLPEGDPQEQLVAGTPLYKPFDMQTHFYDPQTSADIVLLLQRVTANLKRAHIAVLSGTPTLTFAVLDHDLVERVIAQGASCGTMGFSAGDQFIADSLAVRPDEGNGP